VLKTLLKTFLNTTYSSIFQVSKSNVIYDTISSVYSFFLFYFILLTFAPVAGDILFRSTRCRTKCHTVKAEIPLSPSILLSSPAACQAGSQKHLRDIPPAAASDSVSSVCCRCTLC